MDIVVWLYFREMNTLAKGIDHPDRDVYFSSKGHDVPGLYAVLHAGGVVSSRAAPQAAPAGRARRPSGRRRSRHRGQLGLAGHGHLQGEGDGLGQAAAGPRRPGLRPHRRRRAAGRARTTRRCSTPRARACRSSPSSWTTTSSRPTSRSRRSATSATSRRASAPTAGRCSGATATRGPTSSASSSELRRPRDVPAIVIADTIKGRGVSFMEHPRALADGRGLYRWHAGAPDDESFARASEELLAGVRAQFERLGLGALDVEELASDAAPSLGGGPARVRGRSLRPGAGRAGRAPARHRGARRRPRGRLPRPRRSRRSIPTASSRTASPSRTWCRWPADWRAPGCCRW